MDGTIAGNEQGFAGPEAASTEWGVRRSIDMLARSSALPSCVIRCIVFWLLHISPSATGQDAMKYSVIVVRQNLHNSNLFADRDRLNAYTEGEVNVQFANSRQLSVFDPTRGSPFGVGHPQGMDKRIRIIHTWDLLGNHNTIPDIPDLGEIKVSPNLGGPWNNCYHPFFWMPKSRTLHKCVCWSAVVEQRIEPTPVERMKNSS